MYSKEQIEMIKEANRRIKLIESRFGKESWAEKKLKARLENTGLITKTGLLSRRKNIKETQKKAMLKAVKHFLESETSTLEGISEVETRIKSDIRNYTSQYNLSDEEVQDLYIMFEDEDFKDLSKYIPPSDLHILILKTKSLTGNKKSKKEFFMQQIKTYAEFSNDMDIKKTANKVFKNLI